MEYTCPGIDMILSLFPDVAVLCLHVCGKGLLNSEPQSSLFHKNSIQRKNNQAFELCKLAHWEGIN